jgi:hypothetical protein
LGWAAVVITAVDLGVANRWMIASAPATLWHTPSAVAEFIHAREASSAEPYRVDRVGEHWRPAPWASTSSPHRQIDGLAWDRQTLYPRHALSEATEMLDVPDTSAVFEYHAFLDCIQRLRAGEDVEDDRHARGLDALGVRYSVLSPGAQPPRTGDWRRLPAATTAVAPDVRLWENIAALPKAWIVRQVELLPPLLSRQASDVAERTDEVLFPQGKPRDFRASAALETDEETGAWGAATGAGADRCSIVSYEPQRVQLEVELAQPGLVVLSDLYYPGWTAEVASADEPARAAPILRTNRVMRGIALPAGKQTVTFAYRPGSVFYGAIVSGLAWLALIGVLIAKRSMAR